MAPGLPRMDKAVLLAPAALARAAVLAASEREERWLLRQPRPVRASYVKDVMEAGDEPKCGGDLDAAALEGSQGELHP